MDKQPNNMQRDRKNLASALHGKCRNEFRDSRQVLATVYCDLLADYKALPCGTENRSLWHETLRTQLELIGNLLDVAAEILQVK